jgi:hypothetical protein
MRRIFPVVYYQYYLRSDLGIKLIRDSQKTRAEKIAFSSYDLYDYIGIKLDRVEQSIRAINAKGELSLIFQISEWRL